MSSPLNYIASFLAILAKCETREELVPLWKAEEAARKSAGIQPDGFLSQQLYLAWIDRGREITSQSTIRSETK